MDILDKHKLTWEGVDAEHVKVTFHGHFDDNYAQLERELNQAGLHAVKRTYDKKNNKTITVYKRTHATVR